MPTIAFTPYLERYVSTKQSKVSGATVREALEAALEKNPKLRGYILDDQGNVRRHVAVCVNGRFVKDRHRLSDHIAEDARVFVMQALSGG